jgi:RHS repeat-associated protein
LIEENTQGFGDTEFTIKYSHDIFNHPVTKRKTLIENNQTSISEGETYLYDSDGQLSEIQSPKLASGKQLITQFTYNKNGKRIKAVLPSGQSILQTYNSLNLPHQSSWRRNGKRYHITHQYDADRRLISTKDSENQLLSFSYLDNGLLTGITYPDGQRYSVTYDERNRKAIEKTFAGPVHHFHYESKDLGQLSSVSSDDLSVHYHYGKDDNDYKHQLIQRSLHQPKTGETVESMTYGALGIPVKTEVFNRQEGVVYEVNYGFNARKQLVVLSANSHKGHAQPEPVRMHYRYNALNQLVEEKVTNGDDSRELHYQHDANGNLTLEQELIDGKHSNKTFVYNPWDQLVQVVSSYTPHNGRLSYDGDGRLIKDHQGLEYAYDDSGYLLSVNTPTERIDYDYWPNGHLSNRKISNAQVTTSTQIYHDHNKNIIAMNDNDHWRYLLKDDQGILASSDVPTATSANENTAIDESNTNEWFMSNHSVGALLSDAGDLSTKHYMAYGASINSSVTDRAGRLGWHQQYLDSTADLVYFKSRFYSPALKRFITPDNLLVDNRYRYAKSNPLFYHDPTGHISSGMSYGLGIGVVSLGLLGIALAVPTGGASLTASGEAAIVAGASTTVSGAALVGSQLALDSGNTKLAKYLQFGSIGFGALALGASAVSLAPAIGDLWATGEFSVSSHWYDATRVWQKLADNVPGARVAEGGRGLVLTGQTTGEKAGTTEQRVLSLSEWRRILGGPNTSTVELARKINLYGQVPPTLNLTIPHPFIPAFSAIAGSITTIVGSSLGAYQTFTYPTDTEDTNSESTSADTNQHKQAGVDDSQPAEVLNWTEIRGHQHPNASDEMLKSDAFFSATPDPFGIH